jgi:hypothetical protein
LLQFYFIFPIHLFDEKIILSIYGLYCPRNKDFYMKLEEIYDIYLYFNIQLNHLKAISLRFCSFQSINGGHFYLGPCAPVDGVHGLSPSRRGGDFGWSQLRRPLYISGHGELPRKKFRGNFSHVLYAKLRVGGIGGVDTGVSGG